MTTPPTAAPGEGRGAQPSDIADFVPGGIRSTDVWHRKTSDGTCSRCRALVSDHECPLMLFSASGDDMLLYCQGCLTRVPSANDNEGLRSSGVPSVAGGPEPESKTPGGPVGVHSLSAGRSN